MVSREPLAGLGENAKAMLHGGPNCYIRSNSPNRTGFALVSAGMARPGFMARWLSRRRSPNRC